MDLIHKAISMTEVAERYYRRVFPGRKYDRVQSQKQFLQDKNINRRVVVKIITEIFKEQKELLK